MTTEEREDGGESDFFSHRFLAHQRVCSLRALPPKGPTPTGHGPFYAPPGKAPRYDLLCSRDGNLLGHSHPLLLKSLIEATRYPSLRAPLGEMMEKEALELYGDMACARAFGQRHLLVRALFQRIRGKRESPPALSILGEAPPDLSPYRLLPPGHREASLLVVNPQGLDPTSLAPHLDFCRRHAIPLALWEADCWGRTPGLGGPWDIRLLGGGIPLDILLSKESLSPEDIDPLLPVPQALLTKKILHLFKEGDFLGPKGRIVGIQESFRRKVEALLKTFPTPPFSHENLGLVSSFTFGAGPEEMRRVYLRLLEAGIVAEHSGEAIRFYLPTTVLDSHLEEICALLGRAIRG